MTCIVGVVDKDTNDVYIGGDSAGTTDAFSLTILKTPKVFKRGPFIFGCCGSFRHLQLLQYDNQLNDLRTQEKDEEDFSYLVNVFIKRVIKLYEKGGKIVDDCGTKTGGFFLLGYNGNLYEVEDDFSIIQSVNSYDACGCAEDLALGSLHTSERLTSLSPIQKIELALETAEKFNAAVKGPFNIVKLEYINKDGQKIEE